MTLKENVTEENTDWESLLEKYSTRKTEKKIIQKVPTKIPIPQKNHEQPTKSKCSCCTAGHLDENGKASLHFYCQNYLGSVVPSQRQYALSQLHSAFSERSEPLFVTWSEADRFEVQKRVLWLLDDPSEGINRLAGNLILTGAVRYDSAGIQSGVIGLASEVFSVCPLMPRECEKMSKLLVDHNITENVELFKELFLNVPSDCGSKNSWLACLDPKCELDDSTLQLLFQEFVLEKMDSSTSFQPYRATIFDWQWAVENVALPYLKKVKLPIQLLKLALSRPGSLSNGMWESFLSLDSEAWKSLGTLDFNSSFEAIEALESIDLKIRLYEYLFGNSSSPCSYQLIGRILLCFAESDADTLVKSFILNELSPIQDWPDKNDLLKCLFHIYRTSSKSYEFLDLFHSLFQCYQSYLMTKSNTLLNSPEGLYWLVVEFILIPVLEASADQFILRDDESPLPAILEYYIHQLESMDCKAPEMRSEGQEALLFKEQKQVFEQYFDLFTSFGYNDELLMKYLLFPIENDHKFGCAKLRTLIGRHLLGAIEQSIVRGRDELPEVIIKKCFN